MNEIAILNQMIKNSARIPVEIDAYGNTFATLVEAQDPTSKVTIHRLPANALIIKVDTLDIRPVFNGSKDECKRADYAVIIDDGGKKRILYIEMKKTKDQQWSIISQLKGATCFIAYCREIAKEFWNDSTFFAGFEPRYVSFGYTGSINKQKTRVMKPAACHNTPETMMKVAWPRRSEFNHLVGA